jgi:hypothetical protein
VISYPLPLSPPTPRYFRLLPLSMGRCARFEGGSNGTQGTPILSKRSQFGWTPDQVRGDKGAGMTRRACKTKPIRRTFPVPLQLPARKRHSGEPGRAKRSQLGSRHAASQNSKRPGKTGPFRADVRLKSLLPPKGSVFYCFSGRGTAAVPVALVERSPWERDSLTSRILPPRSLP